MILSNFDIGEGLSRGGGSPSILGECPNDFRTYVPIKRSINLIYLFGLNRFFVIEIGARRQNMDGLLLARIQFGMNWSEYSRYVGDIFGAPLAIEALLAIVAAIFVPVVVAY
jgi:hypothetical protein